MIMNMIMLTDSGIHELLGHHCEIPAAAMLRAEPQATNFAVFAGPVLERGTSVHILASF